MSDDDVGKYELIDWSNWDCEDIMMLFMAMDIRLTREQMDRLRPTVQRRFERIEAADRP